MDIVWELPAETNITAGSINVFKLFIDNNLSFSNTISDTYG